MGATLLTSTIVSSVSGTYNEVLTLPITTMTTDEYKGYILYYSARKLTYIIASNTSSTITLETPTTAYFDLTGKTILVKIPSDYFGLDESDTFPEIDASLHLNRANKMTTEMTTSDLKRILPLIEGYILDFLQYDSAISEGEYGYTLVKNVILSMLQRWNRRRQFNKTTNQIEMISDSMVPDFTAEEIQKLNSIRVETDEVSGVFDTKYSYGKRINVSDYWGYYY